MPGDKCHLTTSHQRITPSTRPYAAEADCGSGWQMLVRSPCCQFLFFFFLFHNVFISEYIRSSQCTYFKYLYFYLLTVPQESQTKVKHWFIFFCPVFHTALWAQSLSTAQVVLRAENPHESLEYSAQLVSILPIYSFIIYSGPLVDRAGEHCSIR